MYLRYRMGEFKFNSHESEEILREVLLSEDIPDTFENLAIFTLLIQDVHDEDTCCLLHESRNLVKINARRFKL